MPTTKAPYKPVAVPELGAHALGLPYLEYLLHASISSVLIGRDRIIPITVPHPGRFCVHKLAMFSLRPGADSPKRGKDVLQAAALAAALMHEEDFQLTEAIDSMHKTLRTRVKPGAKQALKYLADDYPEAAQIVETLA